MRHLSAHCEGKDSGAELGKTVKKVLVGRDAFQEHGEQKVVLNPKTGEGMCQKSLLGGNVAESALRDGGIRRTEEGHRGILGRGNSSARAKVECSVGMRVGRHGRSVSLHHSADTTVLSSPADDHMRSSPVNPTEAEARAILGRQYAPVNEGGHDQTSPSRRLGTEDIARQCTF